MTRYQLVKLVEWAGTLQSRKRLQKVVFLLQAAGCPFDAEYTLHHYGPYSQEVARLSDEMVQTSLLEEESQQNQVGVQYSYELTDHATARVRELEATPEGKQMGAQLKPYEQQAKNLLANYTQLGVCSMMIQSKLATANCPVTLAVVRQNAKVAYDDLVRFCEACDKPFWIFEKELLVRIAVLGCCLIRLFLTARYERLDLQRFLQDGKYRPGADYAERTLKTFYGEVTYGRHYLMLRNGGSGFLPLDIEWGLTRDRLSPWVMQWVARLSTRLSFKAAQMVCKAALNGAPAPETIEQIVLGMTRGGAVHATTGGAAQ